MRRALLFLALGAAVAYGEDVVRVRVVTFDGQPVTAARLEVRRSQSGRFSLGWPEWNADLLEAMWKETPPGADDTLVATAETGADGWAEIGTLRDGAFDVTARVPGRVVRGAQVLSPSVAGAPAPTILLDEGHAITGRVRTEDGEPVAGACVVAAYAPAGTARWQDEERPLIAVADENGAFRIDGLPREAITLYASPPGTWFQRDHFVRVPRAAPVEIVLPMYELDVVVKDDRTGDPVPDAPVFFSTYGFHMSTMVIRARTDAEGRIRMRAPNPYLGRGLIIAPGYLGPLRHEAWEKSCNRRFAGQKLELRAVPAAPVRGVVCDVKGPVAGALVTGTWLEGFDTVSTSTRSGDDGAFVLSVRAGTVHVGAVWPCSLPQDDLGAPLAIGKEGEHGILRVASAGRDGLKLLLPARRLVGAIAARIVTKEGAPVTAWPRVVGIDRSRWPKTAGDGTVTLDGVPVGEARILVGKVTSAPIRVRQGEATPRIDFVVPSQPSVHVEGRVVGDRRAAYVSGTYGRRFPVASDGSFAFDASIFAGEVSVRAADAEGWTAAASAKCKAGETCRFDGIALKEPLIADLRVLASETGAPLADATASLYFPPDAVYCGNFEDSVDLGWHVDEQGRVRFPIPRDLDFEIQVRAPGRSGRDLRYDLCWRFPRGDVELKPLGALAGRVRFADGKPATGVRVEAATGWSGETPHEKRETLTDADGRFRIDGLASAVHQVLVESAATGSSIVPLKKDVAVPDESLDLVVEAGPAIEGRVIDVRGRPVFDALVRASRRGEVWERETYTDAKGRFRFPGTGTTKYDIEVSEFGVYPFGKAKGVTAGKEIVVRAELGYRIEGKVLDGDGLPRAGCVVSGSRQHGGWHRVRTDVLGRFVLDEIEGGLWDLEVEYHVPDSGGKGVRAGTTNVVLVFR